MKVNVDYFAALREQRGLSSESVETTATTVSQLYAQLAEVHGFRLDSKLVKFSVNDEFVKADQPLHEDDRIVFVPPVAGG